MNVGESPSNDDADLVARCRDGDRTAFDELVRRYQDRIFNLCLRMCGQRDDAADLVQEAFVKAFTSLEQFGERAKFYTWLYRIATNLAIDRRRRTQRPPLSLDQVSGSATERARRGFEPAGKTARPDQALVAAEQQEAIAAAILELDDDHRVVVVLRDVEGFDYEQVAEVLGLPIGTVKSRLFRARLALRNRLGPILGDHV